MEMSVVAEGVETRAQFEFLAARNCDGLQGYYFSPPVAATDLTAMLVRQREYQRSAITKVANSFELWPNMLRDGPLSELDIPPPSRRH